MTAKEINKSIETMRLHLTKNEKIEHWLNFILILFHLFFIGWVTIESAYQSKEFSFFGLFLLGIVIMFLRHKIISPKLTMYKLNLTEEQFKEANEATAKLNEWIVKSNRKNYFTAIQPTNLIWEGIKITAILKNGTVYLNSMVNPSYRSNPLTFGLNKKNQANLISQYQSILNGINVLDIANNAIKKREIEFWNESEWTFYNTIKRTLGYGLSLIFVLISIWMISQKDIRGLILGISLLAICISYVYYDLKVIREKKKS